MTQPAEQGIMPQGAVNGTDARLIMELVAGISPAQEILERYGLTVEDLKAKLRNPMFKAAYREVKREWGADRNVQKRIRYKAGLLTEDLLTDMFLMVKNDAVVARDRIEAFKQLTNVAGTATPPKEGEAGGGFSVVIQIGDSPEKAVRINNERTAPRPAIEYASELE